MLINASSAQSLITLVQAALKVLTVLNIASYKYPEQTCVYDGRSFDYVIVGAGTAGCVLANRLVEDNETTVLLIEAGDSPQAESDTPALMLYLQSSAGSWNYTVTDPALSRESHKETKDDLALGRTLGGSSSSSYLTYTPGSKEDYNEWARMLNDTTWTWENVLPYLKKSQRLEDEDLAKTDGEFFGQDGNIGLTVLRGTSSIKTEPYFKAFSQAGIPKIASMNGNTTLGYSNAIFTISNNLRQSSAVSYLLPERNNPNLFVLKNTMVKKVIFDGYRRAIGVEAVTCDKRYIVIKARKEVILSAGVVNTPKILMLSGIGPRDHLCDLKIHTVADLPVGEGLQDKLGVTLVYNMTNKVIPYRPFNPYNFPAVVLLGHVAVDNSSETADYQSVNYINYPKLLINYCTFTYFYNDTICNNTISTSVNSQMMFTLINKQKFKSRGRILLRSRNYRYPPLIYTNYYSVEEDLEDHARLCQHYSEFEDTESFKTLGGKFKDPKLKACGKYNRKSITYWKCYVRAMMTSQHQYSSTCAMGKVVDPRLKVYGVKRLRVVDASVMPFSTTGGTLGSTFMIAEKAADMIKEDNEDEDGYCY
ncbi:ecdysone oxidase-like [Anticarsia gemmatalis]|uniref:ecdysone oxidase-like n=1 Tax=Anticarsia gemmatalis TaxID=129554 RepID=UPI003F7670CF